MIHNFDTFVNNLNEAATSAQQEMEINAAVDTAIEAELNDKKPAATNPTASLKFDGDYLHWLNDGGSVAKWKAYSGLSFGNTPFNKEDYKKLMAIKVGDPDETSKLNIGYLKALWLYKDTKNISKAKLNDLNLWGTDSDFSKIGWGDFRATLTQTKGDTHGRSSMYIHGGSVAGSHGCIDLTDEMPDFAKWYAAWLVKNSGKTLTLLVDYSPSLLALTTMPKF